MAGAGSESAAPTAESDGATPRPVPSEAEQHACRLARALHTASAEVAFAALHHEASVHAVVAEAALARLGTISQEEEKEEGTLDEEDETYDDGRADAAARRTDEEGAAATSALLPLPPAPQLPPAGMPQPLTAYRAAAAGTTAGAGSGEDAHGSGASWNGTAAMSGWLASWGWRLGGAATEASSSAAGEQYPGASSLPTSPDEVTYALGHPHATDHSHPPLDHSHLSLEERGLVGLVVELLRVHAATEGVQASGAALLVHLAYHESSKQSAVDAGALQALNAALRTHRHSRHVLQAGVSAVLKLTYDSALRSILAIDSGVHEALRELLDGGAGGVGEKAPALAMGIGKRAGPPLWRRLCEASSNSLDRYAQVRRSPTAIRASPESTAPLRPREGLAWW